MKILVLTSVYRDYSLGDLDTSTNVINSFVKEWTCIGHEVVVIHNSHNYPILVHLLPRILRKKIASLINFQIADYSMVKYKHFLDNGASIYRLPIKKYIPHRSPSKLSIKLQIYKIEKILEKNNFIPDYIIGHWASPQMELIYNLKKKFDCTTVAILHGLDYIDSPKFDVYKYLNAIDILGCRSNFQAEQLQKLINIKDKPFVCYSGIPDEYLNSYSLNLKKFDNIKKWKFAFVGRLVAYKNVDTIIRALASIKNFDWELNIIGDGIEKSNLIKLSKELNCFSKIKFYGKIPRDKVMQILNDVHVFAMVSSNEVFGLVYLEAMAASCITIASKNGGVDGIIIDGNNGYLSLENDVDSLKKIINQILQMKSAELKKIVTNGYNTSFKYSDSKVAARYLEYIKNVLEE